MNAVERVRQNAIQAGRFAGPDDLPFQVVHSDYHHAKTKHGHRSRYVLRVEEIHSMTPRTSYVEVICEYHPEEGINSPDEWLFYEVEPKIVTETKYVRK